jgi:hypothetical protein
MYPNFLPEKLALISDNFCERFNNRVFPECQINFGMSFIITFEAGKAAMTRGDAGTEAFAGKAASAAGAFQTDPKSAAPIAA